MRVALVLIAVMLLPGCFGSCTELGRNGNWTQPGLWALLTNETSTAPTSPASIQPGTELNSTWWTGTGIAEGLRHDLGHQNQLNVYFNGGGYGISALVDEDWTTGQTRAALDEILGLVTVANTTQRSAWIDGTLANQPNGGPHPSDPHRLYFGHVDGPFTPRRAIAQLGLKPDPRGPAGTMDLVAGSWTLSVKLPTVTKGGITVDSSDRVNAGRGGPGSDAGWQADANATFARLGLPAPVFKDAGSIAEEACAD